MNMKKLLIISIIAIFMIGIMAGSVDAAHTFHKGKYKLTVTNKQYKKLTNGIADGYEVSKKVGFRWKKVYKYKTVKVGKIRSYYNNRDKLLGSKVIKNNYKKGKVIYQTSKFGKKHYTNTGYYQDWIFYKKIRYYKGVKKDNVYMGAQKNFWNPNKVQLVLSYDSEVW